MTSSDAEYRHSAWPAITAKQIRRTKFDFIFVPNLENRMIRGEKSRLCLDRQIVWLQQISSVCEFTVKYKCLILIGSLEWLLVVVENEFEEEFI
ncbi:hypothetical protein BpHYR1_005455 [Brachionus plicatilis]|uniref:Uncharacterized protein n=1 Tax=Brachionus plicatilis TaxID=10195 RepID=A0A3M7S3D3_BRAPC|nr:hypothetical protein BpHYR1_005455 [Brachionus plicatilis]